MSAFSRLDALRAANLASRATTELLRYGSDGNGLPNHPFGTQDPTVELAKALMASAQIERKGMAAQSEGDWAEEIDALTQLGAACGRFLDAWTGSAGGTFYAPDHAIDQRLPMDRDIVFPNPMRPMRPMRPSGSSHGERG